MDVLGRADMEPFSKNAAYTTRNNVYKPDPEYSGSNHCRRRCRQHHDTVSTLFHIMLFPRPGHMLMDVLADTYGLLPNPLVVI